MTAIIRRIHRLSIPGLVSLSWSSILGIGILDYVTGYEVSLSLLYIAPIALIAWWGGAGWGTLTAMLGMGVSLAADRASGYPYSHSLIPYWNAMIRGGIFASLAGALARLHDEITRREEAEAGLRQAHRILEDRVKVRTAELQAAQERLLVLSHQLLETQEAERRHLARELRDEMGQLLTGLTFLLDAANRQISSAVRVTLHEAQTVVDDLLARVRELSLTLRPPLLDDLGLLPALFSYVDRYTSRTGIQVAVQHNGLEGRFPPTIETTAYRIMQEALTNVARHADTRTASMEIWADAETLSLQISDHGTGFDSEAMLTEQATSGLCGMCERVRLVGGRLVIDSAPGEGTRVTAEFPLPTEREGEGRDDPDNRGSGG